MRPQLLGGELGQVSGGYVQHRDTTGTASLPHAVHRAGKGHDGGGGELGVGLQTEAVADGVGGQTVNAGTAVADDLAAVGEACVVSRHFLSGDEGDGGVVVGKVVGHGDNGLTDGLRMALAHPAAPEGVVLSLGKRWVFVYG